MEEPWAKRRRTRSEAAASGGVAAASAAAATRAEKRSPASITIARGRRCPFRVLRLHAREARVSQYRKKNKKPMKRGGQEAFRIVSCEIWLKPWLKPVGSGSKGGTHCRRAANALMEVLAHGSNGRSIASLAAELGWARKADERGLCCKCNGETKYSSAAEAVSVSHVVLLLRHPEAT